MTTDSTILRPYSRDDVERLRGSVRVEHTLARLGAERLRTLLAEREWVAALCDVIADNAGLLASRKDATFQNKVHLAMQAKGFFEDKTPPKGRADDSDNPRDDC